MRTPAFSPCLRLLATLGALLSPSALSSGCRSGDVPIGELDLPRGGHGGDSGTSAGTSSGQSHDASLAGFTGVSGGGTTATDPAGGRSNVSVSGSGTGGDAGTRADGVSGGAHSTAGAGGGLGTGGASTDAPGGSPGASGAQNAGACTSVGAVTFRMFVPAGQESSSCAGDGCDGAPWVSVVGPDGEANGHVTPSRCSGPCSECAVWSCPGFACLSAKTVPVTGATWSWDGVFYPLSTCTPAGSSSESCYQTLCAVPGHYVATMCATAALDGGECPETGDPTVRTCVDVSFDYPTSEEVVGTIAGLS
jgi:hypothetical protein